MIDLDRQPCNCCASRDWGRRGLGRPDGIEAAREANGPDGPRHNLARCNFFHPDDLARMRELGMVAEFSHTLLFPRYIDAMSDLLPLYLAEPTLDRFLGISGLPDAGGVAVLGSDWVMMPTPGSFHLCKNWSFVTAFPDGRSQWLMRS